MDGAYEVLDDGCDDHAECGAGEAGLDLFQGREVESHACEGGVEELVEDGDEAAWVVWLAWVVVLDGCFSRSPT